MLVCDFHMPGFTGLEVLEIVMQQSPRVRRVLCTASPHEPEVREALKLGIVEHLLEKPFSRADLRKAIGP